MQSQEEDVFLAMQEACRYLGGVSRQALHRYVKRGKLTKYTRELARRVFFKRSELDALREIRPA